MAKTSLSGSTIKTLIDPLAKDIECQVLKKITTSPYLMKSFDRYCPIIAMVSLRRREICCFADL